MKVLFDTNIILDVIIHREPHYEKSAEMLELCRLGLLEGMICSLSYATIAYIIGKAMSQDDVYNCLEKLMSLCKISVVDVNVIKDAIKVRRKDFEDSVQYYSGKSANVDCIITRDKTGFTDLPIKVLTPTEFIENSQDN